MDSGLQDRVTHLWYTMFGPGGGNGVHGTVRAHGKDIEDIRKELRRYETLETQITVLIKVGQWAALAVSTTIGLLASGSIADFVQNIIRAGAGK